MLRAAMTVPSPFTDELRQRAVNEIAAGRGPDEVLRELIARGIPEELAVDELTRLLESRLSQLKQQRVMTAETVASVDEGPNTVPQPRTAD